MSSKIDTKNPSAVSKRVKKQSLRQLWLDIHLYLGLFAGALLVVFGITGSILVFFQEIDEWLNPQLLTVSLPVSGTSESDQTLQGEYQSLSSILNAAHDVVARDSTVSALYAPRYHEGVFMVSVDQASGASQRIFVDPYRAQVTGVRSYTADDWVPSYLIDFIFKLHFSLLMGLNGMTLVAIVALLLLISLITGLIIWWPKSEQWRKALTIKFGAGSVRLNFDLHKTSSLYFCPVMAAVLLSGVYMNLNDPFVWVTQQFSPDTREPPYKLQSHPNTSSENKQLIDIETVWQNVLQQFPQGELNAIYFPENESGVFVVTQKNVPNVSRFWSERQIAVNQYSGEIIEVRAPDTRQSAGETFLDWQWPLHSGKAFDWLGRILVCLAGLACPVIYVTGVIRWLQKRRGKQVRAKNNCY